MADWIYTDDPGPCSKCGKPTRGWWRPTMQRLCRWCLEVLLVQRIPKGL